MAKRQLPCPTVLRLLLRYEPETGELFWKERAPAWFEDRGKHTRKRQARVWNARYAGKPALTADDGLGYRVGRLFDNLVRAHRAAWAIVHGEWPRHDIDHISGDRADNRIANLREATRAENNRNASSRAGSASKHKGVSKLPYGKWRAGIWTNGKSLHLGVFADERDAAHAYDEAARRMHGEFARLNEVTNGSD